MAELSAGILLYRRTPKGVEVLIAHPGGPYFARKNTGAWSVPKGRLNSGEAPEAAAQREWEEETGLALPAGPRHDLGEARLRSGKTVRAWAVAGDVDPTGFTGNTFELEWPPRSGITQTFPEVDELRWCTPGDAMELLNPAQGIFVERLLKILQPPADI